jgi:hypothetical protein
VLKMMSTGMTVLVVVIGGSSLGYAQSPSAEPSAQGATVSDLNALTDARIAIVKAALQLTPEQEKSWQPIEDAIRSRAKEREGRLQGVVARADARSEQSPIEVLRNRNPVEFLDRRADRLAQRAAALKKLAAAWKPLYESLNPDQKRRLGFVTIVALRELRSAAEDRRIQSADRED